MTFGTIMSTQSAVRTASVAHDEKRPMPPRPSTANALETPELRPDMVERVKEESPQIRSAISTIPAIEKAKKDVKTGDGVTIPSFPLCNASDDRGAGNIPVANATEENARLRSAMAVRDHPTLDDAHRITTVSISWFRLVSYRYLVIKGHVN